MKKTKLIILLITSLFYSIQFVGQELPDLIPFRSGKKWGYCDKSKKIIISPKYDEVRLFMGDKAAVRNGIYWGFINKKGSVVIPIKYYTVSDYYGDGFSEARVSELKKKNPKSSDRKGTLKECGTLDASLANPDLTIAYRNMLVKSSPCVLEYFYILDKDGKIKERLDYEINYPEGKKNYSSIKKGKKWIQVERTPTNETPTKKGYDIFRHAGEGLVSVKKDGKWGYADTSGSIKIALKYDYTGDFSEGFALAQSGNAFIVLDNSGKELFTYDKGILIGEFRNGLILVKETDKTEAAYNKRDKFGYIKTNGEYQIIPQFKNATPFYEGYSIIKDSLNKFHFMSTSGTYVPEISNWEIPVECCTEYLGPVENIVQKGGLFKVRKKFSVDPKDMHENATFQYKEKFGFIDAEGKEIAACEYDSTGRFENGICKVVLDRNAGLINLSGKRITELKYEELNVPKPFGSFYTPHAYKTLLDYYLPEALYKRGLIKVVLDDKVGLIGFDGTEYFEN